MSILLHVCCALDEIITMESLKNYYEGEITAFFYNPNIFPYEEYLKRLESFYEVCNRYGLKSVEGRYDPERFIAFASRYPFEAEGGKRCEACMYYRLSETAKLAGELGIENYSTTLLASPKKPGAFLLETGLSIARQNSVGFVGWNFRENGAVQSAREKANGVYIQDYCGCIYGMYFQKMRGYERDQKDYKLLQEQFPEYLKLWDYRKKHLDFSKLENLAPEKIRELVGIIKPVALIIYEENISKLRINGKWLKCKGYNCRLNIMNGEKNGK